MSEPRTPDENFTQLTSDRLIVRRFWPADLDAFIAYRSVPEVALYQGWDAPYPREKGEQMIADLAKLHPGTPGEWFQFAIELRVTGSLIGDLGCCVGTEHPDTAEIGFTLAPAHQGHGYGTEAVRTLLGYLFGELDLHRVSAGCDTRNTASASLMERVGMRREGHRIESYWSKDEWTDEFLYAILAREWRASQPEVPE